MYQNWQTLLVQKIHNTLQQEMPKCVRLYVLQDKQSSNQASWPYEKMRIVYKIADDEDTLHMLVGG